MVGETGCSEKYERRGQGLGEGTAFSNAKTDRLDTCGVTERMAKPIFQSPLGRVGAPGHWSHRSKRRTPRSTKANVGPRNHVWPGHVWEALRCPFANYVLQKCVTVP